MKELKIEVPEGFEIDKDKSTFEKIVFKPIKKGDLSWEEIQELNKKKSKTQFYIKGHAGVEPYMVTRATGTKYTRNHLPSEKIANKMLALCQMHIIAEYYNEGWEPDWSNHDELKITGAWNIKNGKIYGAVWCILLHPVPIFKSEEVLMRAYNANKEIFETALKP